MRGRGFAVAVVVLGACQARAPLSTASGAGENKAGTAGTSGGGGASGAGGAARMTTAGGPDSAGTSGAARITPTGDMGGAAGDSGPVLPGAAGSAAGGAEATAGTTAGTSGGSGTQGPGAGGVMGQGGPASCMNSMVWTAGAKESNCTPKNAWVASAMPTPPIGLDGIPSNLLLPQYAIDGDAATRYSSGETMEQGDYFQVDLGALRGVSGIAVDTSTAPKDVANGYQVGLSVDGVNFTVVSSCQYPAVPVETINFVATEARYVRYTNEGAPPAGETNWLSINEFDVLCN